MPYAYIRHHPRSVAPPRYALKGRFPRIGTVGANDVDETISGQWLVPWIATKFVAILVPGGDGHDLTDRPGISTPSAPALGSRPRPSAKAPIAMLVCEPPWAGRPAGREAPGHVLTADLAVLIGDHLLTSVLLGAVTHGALSRSALGSLRRSGLSGCVIGVAAAHVRRQVGYLKVEASRVRKYGKLSYASGC